MRQLEQRSANFCFCGTVENTDDLYVAELLAEACHDYAVDEDDEDYCNGARTCFNCRYRRWLTDGFSCVRDRLENMIRNDAKANIKG